MLFVRSQSALAMAAGSSDMLYLLLEIEKVIQNHSFIPTTFLYPVPSPGGFSFSGCTYHLANRLIYEVSKQSIHSDWSVRFLNTELDSKAGSNTAGAVNGNSLYDTLEQLNSLLDRAEYKIVQNNDEMDRRLIAIWENSEDKDEALSCLQKYAQSIRNRM